MPDPNPAASESGLNDSQSYREVQPGRRSLRSFIPHFPLLVVVVSVSIVTSLIISLWSQAAINWAIPSSVAWTFDDLEKYKREFHHKLFEEPGKLRENIEVGVRVGVLDPTANLKHGSHAFIELRWGDEIWIADIARRPRDMAANAVAIVRVVPEHELRVREGFHNKEKRYSYVTPIFQLSGDGSALERFIKTIYDSVLKAGEPYDGKWTLFHQCASWIIDQFRRCDIQIVNYDFKDVYITPSSLINVLDSNVAQRVVRFVGDNPRVIGTAPALRELAWVVPEDTTSFANERIRRDNELKRFYDSEVFSNWSLDQIRIGVLEMKENPTSAVHVFLEVSSHSESWVFDIVRTAYGRGDAVFRERVSPRRESFAEAHFEDYDLNYFDITPVFGNWSRRAEFLGTIYRRIETVPDVPSDGNLGRSFGDLVEWLEDVFDDSGVDVFLTDGTIKCTYSLIQSLNSAVIRSISNHQDYSAHFMNRMQNWLVRAQDWLMRVGPLDAEGGNPTADFYNEIFGTASPGSGGAALPPAAAVSVHVGLASYYSEPSTITWGRFGRYAEVFFKVDIGDHDENSWILEVMVPYDRSPTEQVVRLARVRDRGSDWGFSSSFVLDDALYVNITDFIMRSNSERALSQFLYNVGARHGEKWGVGRPNSRFHEGASWAVSMLADSGAPLVGLDWNLRDASSFIQVLYFNSRAAQDRRPSAENIVPIGTIIFFSSAHAALDGFVLCDGRRLRITEHRELFELVRGTPVDGEDGEEFAIPDLQSLFENCYPFIRVR